VDGDEERSGGIAVCEGAGDGAEASGDAAPASGAEPEESERPDELRADAATAVDASDDDGPPEADEPATEEPGPEVSDVPPASVTVRAGGSIALTESRTMVTPWRSRRPS